MQGFWPHENYSLWGLSILDNLLGIEELWWKINPTIYGKTLGIADVRVILENLIFFEKNYRWHIFSNGFNPFSTNVPLLYPLKTSENIRFSDVFRGYRSGTLVENGLNSICPFDHHLWVVTIFIETIFYKIVFLNVIITRAFRNVADSNAINISKIIFPLYWRLFGMENQ